MRVLLRLAKSNSSQEISEARVGAQAHAWPGRLQ